MAGYISINNFSHNGKAFISTVAIEQVVLSSIEKMTAIANQKIKKGNIFRLYEKIACSIREGKAEIKLSLDIKKGFNVEETCIAIQTAIADDLSAFLEQAPFKIKVRVENII